MRNQTFNNRLLIGAVCLLHGIFRFPFYRDNPKSIIVALGGGIFSLVIFVRWLRQLYGPKRMLSICCIPEHVGARIDRPCGDLLPSHHAHHFSKL
jgi:hypothetical protein